MIGNNLILPNGICYCAKVNGFALEIVLFLITSGQPTATQRQREKADNAGTNHQEAVQVLEFAVGFQSAQHVDAQRAR